MSSSASSASGGEGGKGRRGTGRSRSNVPPKDEQPGKESGDQATRGQQPPPPTTTTTTTALTEAESGQRGRIRAGGERSTSPSEESPPSGSPPGESPEREGAGDLEDRMKSVSLVELATRPGYGTAGKRVMVLANHFEIKIPDGFVLFQYHIEISHERMKLNRDEKRLIFWRCIETNPAIFGDRVKTIYDGDHICVTQRRLQFPKNSDDPGCYIANVSIRLPRMEKKPETFHVRFQLVGPINVNMREVRTATANERFTTPLSILDILFRQNRTCTEVDLSKAWYPFASTVYRIARENESPPLGFGQVIWQGLFGTARVGEDYRPFINFDVSHSSFYRPSSAMTFMIDVLNSNFGGGFKLEQLNSSTSLTPQHIQALNKQFKGITVLAEVKPVNGEPYVREYRVNGFSEKDSVTQTFEMKKDDEVRTLSIAEYFKERYGDLKYPSLQVLSVGSGKRGAAFLPIERCNIKPCQRVTKKLLPNQTADMIKATAMPAANRKNTINQLVQSSGFGQDPWLAAYGIRVNPEMAKVEARILQSPRIEYASRKFATVDPGKGAWDQRQQNFYLAANVLKIGAIIIDEGRDGKMIRDFFGFLLQTCRELGMQVPNHIPDNVIRSIPAARANAGMEELLKGFGGMGAELVMVVLPGKSSPYYPEVKRAAEVVVGIMTQCVAKPTVQKTMLKNDRMTTTNIALKINTKMGGINWKGDADAQAKKILEDAPTLILGIDVTHPGPNEKRAPSIASVVGNIDSSFMRYAASIRVQKHRRESVIYLQEPVRERIFEYFTRGQEFNEERKKQGLQPLLHGKPQRLIIYRDGIAEGQFEEAIKTELSSVRDACKALGGGDYKPSITFIVGQKRHHTRFFPTSADTACGRAGNVFPGTVVEKTITHPKMFEFYLCSHFGIQGTSRPVRYHVLTDDSNFTADQLQSLTFYLTHCFARCTRPVSLPAPLYYADLACRRARLHLWEKTSDFSSDTMSQSGQSGSGEASAASEEELVRGSTVAPALKMRAYFT